MSIAITKLTFIVAGAAIAIAMLASCTNSSTKSTDIATVAPASRTKIYAGILPAADASGINYNLRLEFDHENNFTDGDYDLTETYLPGDSTQRGTTFNSDGDFTVEPGANNAKYLKLVPDSDNRSSETMYFLVTSDSTLMLVNSEPQPAPGPNLNYTLNKVK